LVAEDHEQPGPEVASRTIGREALEGPQARSLHDVGYIGRRRQGARESPQRTEVGAQLGFELLSSPARRASPEQPSLPPSPEERPRKPVYSLPAPDPSSKPRGAPASPRQSRPLDPQQRPLHAQASAVPRDPA